MISEKTALLCSHFLLCLTKAKNQTVFNLYLYTTEESTNSTNFRCWNQTVFGIIT